MDFDDSHPQCSETITLSIIATILDYKQFARFKLMKVYSLSHI